MPNSVRCSFKRNDDERYSAPSPKSEDEVPQLGRGGWVTSTPLSANEKGNPPRNQDIFSVTSIHIFALEMLSLYTELESFAGTSMFLPRGRQGGHPHGPAEPHPRNVPPPTNHLLEYPQELLCGTVESAESASRSALQAGR